MPHDAPSLSLARTKHDLGGSLPCCPSSRANDDHRRGELAHRPAAAHRARDRTHGTGHPADVLRHAKRRPSRPPRRLHAVRPAAPAYFLKHGATLAGAGAGALYAARREAFAAGRACGRDPQDCGEAGGRGTIEMSPKLASTWCARSATAPRRRASRLACTCSQSHACGSAAAAGQNLKA